MGGDVAAPVFSAVVGHALRLLAVAPDEPVRAPPIANLPPRRRRSARRRCDDAAPRDPSAELTAGLLDVPAGHHGQRRHARQPQRAARRALSRLPRRASPRHRLCQGGRRARRARGAVRERRRASAAGAGAAAGGLRARACRIWAARASTIAERFFDAPSHDLTVAGITGTNGKTTCAYLLAQALCTAAGPPPTWARSASACPRR